jgi:YHS domain-containing protein
MKKYSLSLIAILSLSGAAMTAQADDYKVLVLKNREGIAIEGYDPVAYFTDNKAVKGNSGIVSEYEGARYYFASAGHKSMFDGNPAKYAPAYGGYCGYAASIDRLSPISPEWFQIVDGRLILQHNKKAYDKFNADLKGNVMKGDQNWPGLVARNGSGGTTLVFTDRNGVALEGYDPISYFMENKAAKGDAKIEATYEGALYHFVSQEHREVFEKNPSKCAPAYGGYCGYAASIGKVRPADPLLWSIVDGRLIVQNSKGAVELWDKDVTGNKQKADKNWPLLTTKKAGLKDPIDSLWSKSVLSQVN